MKNFQLLRFLFFLHWYRVLGTILIYVLPKKSTKNSILYLPAFNSQNAGFRWRVEKWAEILEKNKYEVCILSAFDENDYLNVIKDKVGYEHTLYLIRNLRKRFWQVIESRKYELVIVRRQLLIYNDYGNLFLEKLLLKIHPKAILDFDDHLAEAKGEPRITKGLFSKIAMENGNYFNESLKLYNNFIVVSDFLKNYIQNINKFVAEDDICVIPTCVDYDLYKKKIYPELLNNPKIGWIGSNNNQIEINEIVEVLNKLSKTYNFSLLIISGEPFKIKTNFKVEFIKWSLESEIRSLKEIDIGIMPLINNIKNKGKGGFKLIQYMGLGIVSLANPITINKEIIEDKFDSFLVSKNLEWEKILISILKNEINLNFIGQNAFNKIKSSYSFNANKKSYLNFIKENKCK